MTENYLKMSTKKLFWLSLLIIPHIIWLYSVYKELNLRMPVNMRKSTMVYKTCVVYILLFLVINFVCIVLYGSEFENYFSPFAFIGMCCFAMLFILPAIEIRRFENYYKVNKHNVFTLLLYTYLLPICVFRVQPMMNEYVDYQKLK